MIKKLFNNILKYKLESNETYLNDIRSMNDEKFKKEIEIEKLKIENELKGTFFIFGSLIILLLICFGVGIICGILESCGII